MDDPHHSQTRTLVDRLKSDHLFFFEEDAAAEIDNFFKDTAEVAQSGGRRAVQRTRGLAYLNAAEFALTPAFTEPEHFALPPAAAVTVTLAHARLSLFKGDCCLIWWTHPPAALAPSDLTVFSGDTSKLERSAGSLAPSILSEAIRGGSQHAPTVTEALHLLLETEGAQSTRKVIGDIVESARDLGIVDPSLSQLTAGTSRSRGGRSPFAGGVRTELIRAYEPIFRSMHSASRWQLAETVSRSGVLQLQSLLWQLKVAVASTDYSPAIDDAVRNYLANDIDALA